jgi:hypothetical protein
MREIGKEGIRIGRGEWGVVQTNKTRCYIHGHDGGKKQTSEHLAVVASSEMNWISSASILIVEGIGE